MHVSLGARARSPGSSSRRSLPSAASSSDTTTASRGLPPAPWVSRAIPEGRGEIKTLADGKTQAVRYAGWSSEDFGRFRTYAYDDPRPEVPVAKAPMPAIKGDPKKGRSLFLNRNLGPCTGCHLVQGEDVWPAGNVGPDLSTYGDRKLPAEYTFNLIYDPRHLFPHTIMPPWGAAGVLGARGHRPHRGVPRHAAGAAAAGEGSGTRSEDARQAGRLR